MGHSRYLNVSSDKERERASAGETEGSSINWLLEKELLEKYRWVSGLLIQF